MKDCLIGGTVAHYKVVERLGGGAMGDVFLAEDTRLGRDVALKFLPAAWCCDLAAVRRFKNEARAASGLDHPNICTIHAIEETEDDRVFIVMSYYEGPTIRERIAGGPLPLPELVGIAIRVAEGLARAHQRGIVHRDVKPANVITTGDGVIKILDFGLAKLTGDDLILQEHEPPGFPDAPGSDETTITDAAVGTPAYMSPEQVRREIVDRRTDIWSLGAILYEMTTGVRPFRGDTAQAVASSILNDSPEPLTALRADAPDELQQIVDRALAKETQDRYQQLDSMLIDLRLLQGKITAAGTDGAPARSRPSIAVLPFRNISADPEQEFFCDGITEEIINALTRVESLRVVARSSAFAFKGKELDVREIGRQLDVGAVLEGSVRRSGDTLRITAQLIDVAGGFHHWSERFDREMRDVFAVQDEIAQAIVEATNVKLVSPGDASIVRKPTQDVEAYSLYLKGRFHWNKRTDDDLRRAIDCFEQAISRDPGFALALSGLADSYNVLGYYSFIPPEEAFPKAVSNSVRALEFDDALAEAHTSLAFATMLHGWDWSSAERAFLRALGLCPCYPTAQHWYAEYLAFRGRMDEALVMAEAALENDPLSLIINTLVGWVHYYSRDYERAAEKLQEVLDLEAGFVPAHLWLGLANSRLGRPDEAIGVLRRGIRLARGNPVLISALGCAYAAAGKTDGAEGELNRLIEVADRAGASGYHAAAIHAALGRKAEAFAALEQALGRRDLWMVFLGIDPVWDEMREEPRFAQLLRGVGLPAAIRVDEANTR